jgi:hypothetical protein
MLTRSVTCAILNGIGDIISQIFLEEQELDWMRLGTFTGLVGAGAQALIPYDSIVMPPAMQTAHNLQT